MAVLSCLVTGCPMQAMHQGQPAGAVWFGPYIYTKCQAMQDDSDVQLSKTKATQNALQLAKRHKAGRFEDFTTVLELFDGTTLLSLHKAHSKSREVPGPNNFRLWRKPLKQWGAGHMTDMSRQAMIAISRLRTLHQFIALANPPAPNGLIYWGWEAAQEGLHMTDCMDNRQALSWSLGFANVSNL